MTAETYPYSAFTLKLELGNDAMQTPEDVIDALRRVAQMMENGGYEGHIMDNNGAAPRHRYHELHRRDNRCPLVMTGGKGSGRCSS